MGATLTSNQVTCSNCEEAVHRFASRCPYCNHDLQKDSHLVSSPPQVSQIQPVQSQPSKVTHLTQPEAFPKIEQSHDVAYADDAEESSPVSLFASLLMLLGGSFFLFFGLMIKLFSKNGRFTLEWSAETWPYFLFPALFLLFFGLMSLSSVSEETE